MQAYLLQTASVDGQYNYHDGGRQHRQYHQLQPQPPIQQQHQQHQQQQQQHQQHIEQHPQALVFPPQPHSFLQIKREELQNSSQQLALIPHITTASVQAPRVRTAHNTQAIRKHYHHQQNHYNGPRQYRYNPEHRQQLQIQQQYQQQNHKHKHNTHQCLCHFHGASPRQASKPGRRPARFSREKEASLRCWLSEYIDAGEVQGSEINNPDEVEHDSEMYEPFPHTPTSPNSMALSPSQTSNGPVSDRNHRHNKDRDSQQTLQTFEIKGEVDQTDTALWSLVPFSSQEQAHALGQMQSSFGTGHELFPYSSTLMLPVSSSHSQMICMPPIQEGQEFQFDPLVTGYHQHNMGLVGDAFDGNPQQPPQGFGVSFPVSNCMSFSSMSTESGEGQLTQPGSVRMGRECSGVSMAFSRSSIEDAANTGSTWPAQNSAQELHIATLDMIRSVSARTLTASENSPESQQLALVDPSLAPTMSPAAPMQHSLSAQSTSSGSSFISHSALYPLYAPSMFPAAFYSTGPGLGQAQPHYLDVRQASNKRSASCMGSYLTAQHASKRRMDECSTVKEEQPPTPCSSGKIAESSFDFDDYIDLASSQRITDVTATGSCLGPAIVRHNGSAEQTMSTDLMRSIEVLSSEAARHTTLVTAVTPPPHSLEHNGTVSPHDLFINPLCDAQSEIKRESAEAPQPCMAMLSREDAPFFADFDPALVGVGGYRGHSAANDSNATELDFGGRGMDDFYPYDGSSNGSPRIPHPSPASDLSPPSCHNQNCELSGQDYTHVPLAHSHTANGRDMHGYEHHQSPYPPCSEAHVQPHGASGPPSPHDAYALRDADSLSVPRSVMGPVDAAEAEISRMRAAEEQRFAECERRRKDHILLQLKHEGYTYREIRAKGNFTEAESTLRGRYRTLTKTKQERVRKPTWTGNDDRLLVEAVNFMARGRVMGHFKVAWKAVSERIVDNGGSYRFGNTTCRKRYDLLVNQGLIWDSPRGTQEDNDDDDEEEEDDEPSIVYFNNEGHDVAE